MVREYSGVFYNKEMERYIHLDFGHGVNVAGKQSPDGRLKEYKWARAYGKMLQQALIAEGYKTFIVVEEEREPTLSVRVKRANKFYKENRGQHIFVSIHCDAFGTSFNNANGMSVRVGTNSGKKSKKLAQCITKEALAANLTGNRCVPPCMYWEQNLYVCNNTLMPAVLIEHGFMTNKDDVEFMLSLEGRKQLIDVTLKGIKKYFDSL